MDRRWADPLLTAVTPITWGTTYLVTSELLPPGRPLWSGVIRALPAGLLLLALTRHRPHGAWWWRSAVLGALNIGAFFPLLFYAAYHLPGGTAAVLGATQPLLVAGLTVLLLGERPRPRALAAAVAALVGVTLVVLRPTAGLDAAGIAAGLTGTAAMGTGLVLTRRWGRPPGVGTLTATGWQLTAGGLMVLPLALAVEGRPPAPGLPGLAGYAWLTLVGTALAYALWFRGAARLPVTQVSLLGALSPLTAAVLGWVVLGQAMTGWQLSGFAVAVGATVVGQLPGRPVDRTRQSRWAGPGWRGIIAATRPAGRGPDGVAVGADSPVAGANGSAAGALPVTGRPAGSSSAASEPGGNSPAATSGSVKRASAAGPAAYDSRSIQRTSSAVQPRPERPAISRSRRSPTRVSSS